jgi:hypothetical protein
MLNFLRFTAYSLILVFFGAFLQFRYDILGLGIFVQYGQYHIVPPPANKAPPANTKPYHNGRFNFYDKVDFKEEFTIEIEGKVFRCIAWYNNTVFTCTVLEKSA